MNLKIIENWLTNTNERSYQHPFCQILLLEGYRVLHQSSHGVGENGKDIISFDPEGKPCAFQLKTGNISSKVWRDIQGEINELVEVPIVHPGVDTNIPHRSVLVTNGRLTDDVRMKIDALNKSYVRRGHSRLEIIVLNDLKTMFSSSQEEFLPKELSDVQELLGFYLQNGKETINCEKFSFFIESRFFSTDKGKVSNSEAKKIIVSTVLLAKYALSPFEKVDNYFSLIKGWTIVMAYLLAFSEKNNLKNNIWEPSYDLCFAELTYNAQKLKDEFLERKNYLEGSLLGDGGEVSKVRTVMVLGILASFELSNMLRDDNYEYDEKLLNLVKELLSGDSMICGEISIVYLLVVSIYLKKTGDTDLSKKIMSSLITNLSEANNHDSDYGIPAPYHSFEEILLNMNFDKREFEIDYKSFTGFAYSISSLVYCLLLVDAREILESCWFDLTRIHYCEFYADLPWKTYFWKNALGKQVETPFKSLQSYKELKKQYNPKNIDLIQLPGGLLKKSGFAPLFLITYPHRIRPDLISQIDDQ